MENQIDNKERAEFEENFVRYANLHYEDIVRITYGKNLIYEDEKFKNMANGLCL